MSLFTNQTSLITESRLFGFFPFLVFADILEFIDNVVDFVKAILVSLYFGFLQILRTSILSNRGWSLVGSNRVKSTIWLRPVEEVLDYGFMVTRWLIIPSSIFLTLIWGLSLRTLIKVILFHFLGSICLSNVSIVTIDVSQSRRVLWDL